MQSRLVLRFDDELEITFHFIETPLVNDLTGRPFEKCGAGCPATRISRDSPSQIQRWPCRSLPSRRRCIDSSRTLVTSEDCIYGFAGGLSPVCPPSFIADRKVAASPLISSPRYDETTLRASFASHAHARRV